MAELLNNLAYMLCNHYKDGWMILFLARLLILIIKGGLLQLKFGGVGVNIYLWER